MPIAVTEEHEELRRGVRRWAERHCTSEVPRALLDQPDEVLPPVWAELAGQGWLGVHVPEELGGQGSGMLELAVVAEELGRALVPGPYLPTVLAAAVLARHAEPTLAKALVPAMVDGSLPACVVLPPVSSPAGGRVRLPEARAAGDGALAVTGECPAVLGAGVTGLLLLPVSTADGTQDGTQGGTADGATAWCAVDLVDPAGGPAPGVTVTARPCLDPTRRSADVVLDAVVVSPERVLHDIDGDDVRDLALVIAAAELAGSARWCLEVAAEHARTRVQFGRPIGQFQGVKHKLADLLALVEEMTAATWDAALALDAGDRDQARLAAAAAGALATEGGVRAAKDAIQVLGGMGFTWEHDAHLHLRRATTSRQVLGGPGPLRASVARQALGGARRSLGVDLPPEVAGPLREELAPVVAEVAAAGADDRRRLLGERGLLFPHWPEPYGRDAGPVEQLVIDELLAQVGIRRPPAHVAAWALPTLIAHGTPEQQERWILPTLRGELLWCQLFSEPGAGSDLAALATRATRVEGGWRLDGQKVWTSVAARADMGICLARTDPEAPKHEGITYFLVDMRTPGIEVRPLREITGDALFNEVFLDGVVVPDDCVVGPVDGGWRLARTTLANERVSLATSSAFGGALEGILAMVAGPVGDGRDDSPGAGRGDDPDDGQPDAEVLDELGRLLVDAQALALLGQRSILRSVSGLEPGPEASIRKLVGAEHDQRVAYFGLACCGAAGAYADGPAEPWARAFLHTLCLTIAGGTSEVQRNVIGERLLGLPRDPEPEAGRR
ncbi:MAG: acyl-CoA dehydrogenase [Acidimicrobiales bacterium]